MRNKKKICLYEEINKIVDSLLESKPALELVTIYSNFSVLLKDKIDGVSWAGFYILSPIKNGLYLGPFSGPLACNYIDINNGVCGACARDKKTKIIQDVSQIPYHIACDSLSRSEIVIPLFINNTLVGVLDLDSHKLSNFDEIDREYLELIAKKIETYCKAKYNQ